MLKLLFNIVIVLLYLIFNTITKYSCDLFSILFYYVGHDLDV